MKENYEKSEISTKNKKKCNCKSDKPTKSQFRELVEKRSNLIDWMTE